MEDLEKSGKGVTDIGYYKEKLFRKIDSGSDVIVRSTRFSGIRSGKLLVVGVNEFVIRESDGENTTVAFSDILDLE